ncbi:hypothetical protein MAC_05669 [Metarhizium acridum CQMa 102]|uniref:Uncharacterized protein n=1 Tax=Metarhizium acridum (strain CQMa 102) TaxID=655827 RepID=E9E6X3_METAQ|nr:uncharacterized protein MAC_05669 [Metarhizium acridum CQMa 102]EFY88328.1 hypothetical protein MAC_05669 [Metarhizium acridum CQMa 102]
MVYPTDHRIAAKSKYNGIKRSSKTRPRLVQSQPVDAEELTRRLFVVLAEQKAHSERKRRARAEAGQLAASLPSCKQHESKDITPPAGKHGDKLDSSPRPKSETKSAQQVESPPKDKLYRPSSKKSNSSSKKGGEEEQKHSPSYRHVPQVAASQFTLTTTIEPPTEKGPVHKLSKVAVKFHLDGPNGSREMRTKTPTAPPCEQAKALRRTQSMRERQYERNQAYQPLPPTFEADEFSHNLFNRNSFHTNSRSREDRDQVKDSRRRSTGSILGRNDAPPIDIFELAGALFSPTKPVATGAPGEHRVDWTQSDEVKAMKAINTPQQSQPKLRKLESRWILRGRLGSFGRHSKDDKPLFPTDEKSPHNLSSKSPISVFFSRFKR